MGRIVWFVPDGAYVEGEGYRPSVVKEGEAGHHSTTNETRRRPQDALSMTKSKRRRRKGAGLPSAVAVLDFRPSLDVVVREDGRTYVRDLQGLYADLEVIHDALNDEVRSNLDRLDIEQAAIMFESIRTTPFLSPEGRKERLDYLLAHGKVTLRFDASNTAKLLAV